MKVRFLGTSSMLLSGVPASYLINNHILIDLPNGNHRILKLNKQVESIDTLIITHHHADHVFDVPFLLLAKLKEQKSLNIYLSKKNYRKIKKLCKIGFPHLYKEMFKSKKIKFIYDDEFIIDGISINRFKVKHGKMKCAFGYTFKEKNKSISFTGDSAYCDNVLDAAVTSDYLVCDATYVFGNDKHMGVNDVKFLLNQNGKLKIYPTHLSEDAKKALKKLHNRRIKFVCDNKEIKI